MARPVNMRVSFAADMRFLMRLKEAIEVDERRPVEFRREASTLLSQLIDLFNRAPILE